MKLTRSEDKFVLHFNKREAGLFFGVLKLYPRVPPAHHKLTRAAKLPDARACQELLDQALAEQRAENKKQLQALLSDPVKLKRDEKGCHLVLLVSEVEWMLQALNDIRVGSWVELGSPEEIAEPQLMDERAAANFGAMELAGIFQMQILEAMEAGGQI